MRIGFDGLLLSPPYSGVQTAIEQMARALTDLLDTDLLLFVPRGATTRNQWMQAARTREAPLSGRNRLARILWEQLCLPGVARRAGVELLHAPGYVMPLRWRGPCVLTVHDLLTLTHPQWCKRGNVQHFRLVLPSSLRRAGRIVVTSKTVAREVRAQPGVASEKVRVIPLGVAENFVPAPPQEQERVRQRYGLALPYLLTVGNLEPKKNLAGTLEIFARLVERVPHQLIIAGGRGWGDPRPWRHTLEELLPDRVKLLGYVPRQDLPALYSGAELYLQLSWYEGFGLCPLEAMACGTAAVVSNRGALPEVAGPGARIVDPADQVHSAEAIERLLRDEAIRRQQAQVGQEYVAKFTWQKHARQLVELYQEVLGHG